MPPGDWRYHQDDSAALGRGQGGEPKYFKCLSLRADEAPLCWPFVSEFDPDLHGLGPIVDAVFASSSSIPSWPADAAPDPEPVFESPVDPLLALRFPEKARRESTAAAAAADGSRGGGGGGSAPSLELSAVLLSDAPEAPWSVEVHAHWPLRNRAAVQTLLLCRARLGGRSADGLQPCRTVGLGALPLSLLTVSALAPARAGISVVRCASVGRFKRTSLRRRARVACRVTPNRRASKHSAHTHAQSPLTKHAHSPLTKCGCLRRARRCRRGVGVRRVSSHSSRPKSR